jgi:hypothetical protein
MNKIGKALTFTVGLIGVAAVSGTAMAGSTQQSSGYIQEAPNVYTYLGQKEFKAYYFQVTVDAATGNALAPKVPVGSSTGNCGYSTSKGGALTYTSGMDTGDSCKYNVYAINIQFADGTWWTIHNPKTAVMDADNKPITNPQALVDGCAGSIVFDTDGVTLKYQDSSGCLKS